MWQNVSITKKVTNTTDSLYNRIESDFERIWNLKLWKWNCRDYDNGKLKKLVMFMGLI